MNLICKVGDLAVTRINTVLDGYFCRVKRLAVVGDHNHRNKIFANDSMGAVWWIDFESPIGISGEVFFKNELFYDRFLFPIRYVASHHHFHHALAGTLSGSAERVT